MKRLNKIALIPAAIAATLAGNAYAGTEACFEVYKGADALAVAAFDTKYTSASCVAQATRAAAGAADLAPTDTVAIAYELTGDLDVEFDAIDTVDRDQHVIYIPTTDVPGGTKITMNLSGATFNGNSNQIHLVKYDEVAADGSFEAVASSDGTVDGTGQVVFLTKAGITIGAGTRLAFSRVSTGANAAALVPVGINITNADCTDSSSAQTVTITATDAVTDGGTGYSIQGAVSTAQDIADISAQFYALHGGTTAEASVNAESSDSEGNAVVARTEFVYDAGDASNQLVAKKYEVVYKTAFHDRAGVLDQAITLDAADHLETTFVSGVDAGTDVKMGLWNARLAATGVLDTQEVVETGTTFGALGLTEAAATVYNTEALDVFTADATGGDAETYTGTDPLLTGAVTYNNMYYVLTNDTPNSIMNFNYDVETNYTLDFGTATELDHCKQTKTTQKIGVNGAVLKVPYVVNGEGNFVRVTNEHDETAEVTFDIFGESADGNTTTRKVTAVSLGTVPAKSSVVYFVPKLVEEAVSQKSYLGADGGYAESALGSNAASNANRHTVTFTVTAPKNTVHGVSVQKVLNGSDRVMPVLDQNDWSQ